MRFDVLSLFPEMFKGFLNHSILDRAQKKNLAEIFIHNFRDKGLGVHKKVDDYPYGGGSGLILRPEPIVETLEELQKEIKYDEVIYLSPDGELFNQSLANHLSGKKNLALICGHYKGLDQRVRDHWVTKEISIGDYVLTGGELPAALLIDAIVRLIPGVLNDESSALSDSFQYGLLDCPHYTRPLEFRGYTIPLVLMSGNHKEIEDWRYAQSLEKTKIRRPDLLT